MTETIPQCTLSAHCTFPRNLTHTPYKTNKTTNYDNNRAGTMHRASHLHTAKVHCTRYCTHIRRVDCDVYPTWWWCSTYATVGGHQPFHCQPPRGHVSSARIGIVTTNATTAVCYAHFCANCSRLSIQTVPRSSRSPNCVCMHNYCKVKDARCVSF